MVTATGNPAFSSIVVCSFLLKILSITLTFKTAKTSKENSCA